MSGFSKQVLVATLLSHYFTKAQHTLTESTAHLKHISEAGNLNYSMSEYAAYFSYTIIQISRYSNMLQMCCALCKGVPRFKNY